MVPPAAGLAAAVSWYCVVNDAVYVVDVPGAVTVCEDAPLSDQLPKTYCVPVAPACVAAATVWLDPASHGTEHGAVHAAPSTVRDSPGGVLVTVIVLRTVKAAVTVAAPDMVRFCGDAP